MKSLNYPHIPTHLAIIMDGNRRWAKRRGLARHLGHAQGAKIAEDITSYANECGIKYLTLYAFSNENWSRSQNEIDAIMKLLEQYLKNDVNELVKNDIRMNAIGELHKLPSRLKAAIKEICEKTSACKKMVVTLALSYGSSEEIISAIKHLVEKKIDISKDTLKQHLYTHDLPDPDLLIRAGGEMRLSNFMLMQLSYSELYFTNTLWPDFQRKDLDEALLSFSRRERRFGGL